MAKHEEARKRVLRTGMKLLLVGVVLAAANVSLPVLRADAGEADSIVTTRHALVAAPSFGMSELAVYPNPARLCSRIRYRLNQASDAVTIKIYDVTGRLVRKLAGPTTAGRNEVDWDLATTDGSGVASGAYLVKVTVSANGQSTTDHTKVAVIR